MRAQRNDDERRQWVLNDEPLYRSWQSWQRQQHRLSRPGDVRAFIRVHRAAIDQTIQSRLSGRPWG